MNQDQSCLDQTERGRRDQQKPALSVPAQIYRLIKTSIPSFVRQFQPFLIVSGWLHFV